VTASCRLAFYGDDFTGSTDALEVLALAGLRCALFLEPPTADVLARLSPLDAIGVAGDSRSMDPAEMDAHLPGIFRTLAALGAPLIHYKVCSTFDSAPGIGSIGRAVEIARRHVSDRPVPIVGGTPALARFCVFGTLFARSGTDNQVHRIDRHPIMSRHPLTPMDEADLALHLARQTPLPIAKLTCPTLDQGLDAAEAEWARLQQSGADVVLFDALTAEHMDSIGDLLWRQVGSAPLFVVGGSGVEHALTQSWRGRGEADGVGTAGFAPVERLLAVSGSASALSAMQIDAAVQAGFVPVAVDAAALVSEAWRGAAGGLVAQTMAALNDGRSVVLHTARGPDDPRIGAMLDALQKDGRSRSDARHAGGRDLAIRLGGIVSAVLDRVPLPRLLLSGGDTSSQITKALAPDALEMAARLAPGAPLCRTLSFDGTRLPLEIALKGGQIGGVDIFVQGLRGCAGTA
jgi:uncharacterized protein YgbK (DUF1537 family)